jgi:hypothetical protein
MAKNKAFGPLLTLVAVAALGGGIWLMNVSQESTPASTAPVAQSATTAARVPPAPVPPVVAFPTQASYVGKIPTRSGLITLEVTVEGGKAVTYACDGDSVEVWLRGGATDGKLALWSKDKASRLDGHLAGTAIVGTLTIEQRSWDFIAAPVAPPAGRSIDGDDDVN